MIKIMITVKNWGDNEAKTFDAETIKIGLETYRDFITSLVRSKHTNVEEAEQ